MLEMGIALLITTIIVVAILYIISIWIYKRAPSNMCFIRTGFLGTKVCLGKGAIVLPVFHEVTWVSLETIKLLISRSREQAILTSDNIRVDVNAELYTHVGHNDAAVLVAGRSLGEKTFDADKVRVLLEAKVVSALRSYAATKTLKELHENRDAFARDIKENVTESFSANGLTLEEVTIVSLEQTQKEFFKSDNVFDAEGLKVITEITSEARKKVHDTEKRTTVSIRQKELTTQLELLEIERQEAVARANQDKEISNEQAKQLGEKQVYVLDQRMEVEQREIDNEKTLERMRTERDVAVTEEARRREVAEIQKELALEQERRDREIALTAKAKEEELAAIARNLARERAEKEKDIELSVKERERQEAEIGRATAVMAAEEKARDERHATSEEISLSIHRRSLETRLSTLEIEKEEALAAARQEQEVSNERARILSEQQRFILEQRWSVEQEEIEKALALEKRQIEKDAEVIEQNRLREAAEIRRALAREREERDREIALVAKAEELERAEIRRVLARESEERDRAIALTEKDGELRRTEIEHALSAELQDKAREIALIEKEKEREKADIGRFLSRELEERAREIALVAKTRELEQAEIERLGTAAEKQAAEHRMESVRIVADAERARELEKIEASRIAEARRIDEENKAEVSRMHMLSQAAARLESAAKEADATVIRARAGSEAQSIAADGIEREAGARGRAEMEIETLRAASTQRMLEAEASGLEAKAGALKKYNEAATYLELARLYIEAERDVHIDQARAMGNALQNAQIRMYGGGGGEDGTVETIRGLFTQGFGLGEILEGFAQSMPEGLRQRFNANGVRGLLGRPYSGGSLRALHDHIKALVDEHLRSRRARDVPFPQALAALEEHAGDNEALRGAVAQLRDFNQQGVLDEVSFDTVWTLLQAAARAPERDEG